jgi:hypothetical protein
MFEVISESFSQESIDLLLRDLREDRLVCKGKSEVKGDKRYWAVDTDNYELVSKFSALATELFSKKTRKRPENVIVMINKINSDESFDGSGGGWHVDSLQNQYKLFTYLTNCEKTSLGPLTLLTTNNQLLDRIIVATNYILGNKFRFSEKVVGYISKLGFKERPVLLSKNKPFWINTSFIHRGAKITEGERILMTAYIYDGIIPPSIQGRIDGK